VRRPDRRIGGTLYAVKILYVASDILLSAAHGGAVHVREVAGGLGALGHSVHAVVKGLPSEPAGSSEHGFEVRRVLRHVAPRMLRFLAIPSVAREARVFAPDVVIERYYNFGGEGALCAARRRVPLVLEVNSPMIEYAGSPKERVDRLVGSPLRRWREHLARSAAAFVTPTPAILPEFVPRERIHVLPWGANTDRFRPDVAAASIDLPAGRPVVAFVGTFRPWHGARTVVDAAAELRRSGRLAPLFLMIGDGPERSEIVQTVRERGLADDFRFVGSLPHGVVPGYLRRAAIGIAPFETSRHRYLEIDFYWSPVKIFEYMAMALPVVTIDVPALRRMVRPGLEGLLYPEGNVAALARSIGDLLDSPQRAAELGRSGRARVVAEFSWRAHCAALDRILRNLVPSRAPES
jgi:glycosyltransferase involved in cell wall biosynthesis